MSICSFIVGISHAVMRKRQILVASTLLASLRSWSCAFRNVTMMSRWTGVVRSLANHWLTLHGAAYMPSFSGPFGYSDRASRRMDGSGRSGKLLVIIDNGFQGRTSTHQEILDRIRKKGERNPTLRKYFLDLLRAASSMSTSSIDRGMNVRTCWYRL